MVCFGLLWFGKAGQAVLGLVLSGMVRWGGVWQVRLSAVRFGMAGSGQVRQGQAGMVGCSVVWLVPVGYRLALRL